jgi:hypothetical protein
VCQERYADLVKDKMWSYYNELMKTRYDLQIKYQNSNPFTKHIMQVISKNTPPRTIPARPWMLNILPTSEPHKVAVRALFKPDDIIEIDPDARSNRCTGTCNHASRVNSYRQNKRCYLGAIVVKLVRAEDDNILSINIKD